MTSLVEAKTQHVEWLRWLKMCQMQQQVQPMVWKFMACGKTSYIRQQVTIYILSLLRKPPLEAEK